MKGYWWQLSLWEFSDAQTEREQHRSHPSPDSTMAATPREPPSLHLCRQGQLLVTERGCEESQGIILFLSHSGTSLIDAWGVFLQNTPPWSRGRSFDFSWLNSGKEIKNFPSYRKWASFKIIRQCLDKS